MSPIPDEAVRALARQSMAMIMAELDAHDAGGKATGSAVVFITEPAIPFRIHAILIRQRLRSYGCIAL